VKLTILLPGRTLVDRKVAKVVAEAPNGSFCLLPRHVDFTTAIAAGIVAFTTPEGEEIFVAVDEGVLVKQSATVRISTPNAVMGEDLGRLNERVAERFEQRDQRQQRALQAMNKIEVGFVRRFLDIQQGE
jgi:F-type H+-transporting ATPase subunit epsilon